MALPTSQFSFTWQTLSLALAWAALGVKLALCKGQLEAKVMWIGAKFQVSEDAVIASITPERLQEKALS